MQQMSKWLFHHLSEGKAHNVIKRIFVQRREKRLFVHNNALSLYLYYVYLYIYIIISFEGYFIFL